MLIFSSAMAQYVEHYSLARRMVDCCHVDSDKRRQYPDNKSWPMNWLYRDEARQLLDYGRRVARDTDASLFVSVTEAELFRKLAPESDTKISHFNNDVDSDYFSLGIGYACEYADAEQSLVFTGGMDYRPNVDAMQWLAGDVLPGLRARFRELRFYIVGARPVPRVQALTELRAVVVTGTVSNVRPYIAHAAVVVAPLRVSRAVSSTRGSKRWRWPSRWCLRRCLRASTPKPAPNWY